MSISALEQTAQPLGRIIGIESTPLGIDPQYRVGILGRKFRQLPRALLRAPLLGDIAPVYVDVRLARHRRESQRKESRSSGEVRLLRRAAPEGLGGRVDERTGEQPALGFGEKPVERLGRCVGVENRPGGIEPQHGIGVLRREPAQILDRLHLVLVYL